MQSVGFLLYSTLLKQPCRHILIVRRKNIASPTQRICQWFSIKLLEIVRNTLVKELRRHDIRPFHCFPLDLEFHKDLQISTFRGFYTGHSLFIYEIQAHHIAFCNNLITIVQTKLQIVRFAMRIRCLDLRERS